MKKRFFIFIQMNLLLLAVICSGAFAADNDPIAAGTGWTLAADGTMMITPLARMSYGNRADVEWYDYMDQILYLKIGEGVKVIGNYAFCDAENLERVDLPEGLTHILLRSFSGCKKLKEVTFPKSLKSIDYWAFAGCDSLEEIIIGSDIFRELNNYVFQGCRGLQRVVILDFVERLGFDVLEHCTSLKELYLPASLRKIDMYALRDCPALSDVYYAGSEDQWQLVKVNDGNSETMKRVTVHFNSGWDPQSAADLSGSKASGQSPRIPGSDETGVVDDGKITMLVAKVGDDIITLEEFQAAVRRERANINQDYLFLEGFYKSFGSPVDASKKQSYEFKLSDGNKEELGRSVLSGLIDQHVMAYGAAMEGITVGDKEVEARYWSKFDYYPDGVPDPEKTSVSEEEFHQKEEIFWTENSYLDKAFYLKDLRYELIQEKVKDQMKTQVPRTADMVWVRQILVGTEAEALSALDRINKGEKWEDVAAAVSLDTSSAKNGGDLGWFMQGDMAKEISDTAFSREVGTISEPVQTDRGWHLIQVLAHEERELTIKQINSIVREAYPGWLDQYASQLDIMFITELSEYTPMDPPFVGAEYILI